MLEKRIEPPALAEAFEAFRAKFPVSPDDISYERGELRVGIKAGDLPGILGFLKSELKFHALVDIVALDRVREMEEGGRRFRLIYQVCRFPENARLHLAVEVGEGETAPSAVGVYKAADWAEREIFDMFGIHFDGHPDLRRIYLPDDFDGHPLRKDFPLEGRTGGV